MSATSPVHHGVDVLTIDLLPPAMIEIADFGKAPFQDAIDIVLPDRRFRFRYIAKVPRFGDRPIEDRGRAARYGFGRGHRPQGQRQHATGERVGYVQRFENVGRTREEELSLSIAEVHNSLDRERQLSGALRFVDNQRPILQSIHQLLQLPPRIALDRFKHHIVVERDESSGLEDIPNQRRLSDLTGAHDVDYARIGQRVLQFSAQMARQYYSFIGHVWHS